MTANQAAAQEADGPKMITFKFDGEEYTYDSALANDLDVLEMFEDGKVIGAIRTIMGKDQWATFKGKKRTDDDLAALSKAMFKSQGVTPGE